jgi:site-specific DNA-methyltransferase (adenine-specific)
MLLNGDCIEEMQKLIDDGIQVDSIVTDPPYHLQSIVDRFGKKDSAPAQHGIDGAFARASKGFLGKEWDGGDIAFRQETWELAMKLLKPGGHLLAFSASRNYHRMAVAIEDAGFEIRDQMMWLYGSGFPKSLNLGDGWGTALKPAHEPIVMARKFIEGTNKNNREKYGTGGINIDGCRVEGDTNLKARVRKAGSEFGQNSGWNGHKNVDTIYNPSKGRFPANVMHDGLKEDWARYFYSPKISRAERNVGLDDLPDVIHKTVFKKINRVSTTTKEVNPIKNNHPTVKPQELMKYLCRLVTPKGGIVLDPFMGSGSTGMAAKDEGFEFIGIEKEKEYFEIAEKRIKAASPLMEFM